MIYLFIIIKNYISCLNFSRSIQNQNYSNFEIIIVDDASDDGTSLTLDKLQKEDPRLKIINNKVNMGGFYSRSIGTFSAKGKHISNNFEKMIYNFSKKYQSLFFVLI